MQVCILIFFWRFLFLRILCISGRNENRGRENNGREGNQKQNKAAKEKWLAEKGMPVLPVMVRIGVPRLELVCRSRSEDRKRQFEKKKDREN